jgi:hypothetical protein
MLQISKMDIEELEHLSRAELRELWEREFAEKAPPSIGRDILEDGFLRNGTTHRSLSTIGVRLPARTGMDHAFSGLREAKTKVAEKRNGR